MIIFLSAFLFIISTQSTQALQLVKDLPYMQKASVIHKAPVAHKPILRHSHDMQALGLYAGMNSLGYEALLAWNYHCSSVLQLKASVGAKWKKRKSSKFSQVFIQPQIAYTLLSNDAYCYVNILAGSLFTYSYYQEEKLTDTKDNLNIGFNLGGAIELFLVNHIALVLETGPVFFLLANPFNKFHYYVRVGLEVNF